MMEAFGDKWTYNVVAQTYPLKQVAFKFAERSPSASLKHEKRSQCAKYCELRAVETRCPSLF